MILVSENKMPSRGGDRKKIVVGKFKMRIKPQQFSFYVEN